MKDEHGHEYPHEQRNDRSAHGERIAALESRCDVLQQTVMTMLTRVVGNGQGGSPGGGDSALSQQIAVLTRAVNRLTTKGEDVAGELDALAAQVSRNTTVVGSAKLLLEDIVRRLNEAIASGDMARVASLTAELTATTDVLAQAVVDHTPGAGGGGGAVPA